MNNPQLTVQSGFRSFLDAFPNKDLSKLLYITRKQGMNYNELPGYTIIDIDSHGLYRIAPRGMRQCIPFSKILSYTIIKPDTPPIVHPPF